MTEQPAISVMMPVYNAEPYVAEAVESILTQTFTDFEFLIVDDGSMDGSLRVLEHYARHDSRIKLRSRPNTGYVVALNEMLNVARGEFIARMDADDVSLPFRFAQQVEYLRDHENCLVVGSATEWIDPDGHLLRVHYPPKRHDEIDAAHLTSTESVICHPSVMMRSNLFKRLGDYNEELYAAEDLDLWLRVAEFGRLANIDIPLHKYRFHFTKVGYVSKKRQISSACSAVARACVRRNLPAHSQLKVTIPPSRNTQLRTWGWWALSSGNVATARKYAWKSFWRQPFLIDNWRLAYCAMRGR